MIYSTKIEETPTLDTILEKVSEYDIYARYLGNFKLGSTMNSPLRKDNNPSFGIFVSKTSGKMVWKDMATGEYGNVVKFIQKLLSLRTYTDALEEISRDFDIQNKPKIVTRLYKAHNKVIKVKRKAFTKKDLEYWAKYNITKETLQDYNVSSISGYFVDESYNEISKEELGFCYKVFNRFKIYRPNTVKLKKWRSSLKPLDIQGFEQLSATNKILIITKSLKDVMVLKELGYDSVAPASETTKIPTNVITNLKQRFNKIYVLYDDDATGQKTSTEMAENHGFKTIYIPREDGVKDISDYVKKYGLKQGEALIKNLLKIAKNVQKQRES